MSLFDRVADLSLSLSGYSLARHARDTSGGFQRDTTVFTLSGAGERGRGEDVCYATEAHDGLHSDPPELPTGEFTFAEYSRALDDVELFSEPPDQDHAPHFRRWAVESAALDLALRQAETDLANALGRTYDPVRFVVSTSLGDRGMDRIEQLIAVNADAEFKLDPSPDWSRDLLDALAGMGRVMVLDLKGLYENEDLVPEASAEFYGRVLETFPNAVVEDPKLTEETRPIFVGEEDRVSWDYPITQLVDVAELPWEPDWLNIKPSRFGTVESLLNTIEYCQDRGIRLYGGGQYELSVGRSHLHAIASIFYPNSPNDVAPGGYNDPEPASDLPASPLEPPADPRGMTW